MSAERGRGLLWGQLLTGLEAARASLAIAQRSDCLLDDVERHMLTNAIATLGGIEQRAWAKTNGPDPTSTKRRTKR
jgi:hypothetical protein